MLSKSDISILLFLVAFLNLGLGVFVVWRRSAKKANVLFFLVAVIVSLWSFCHGMCLRAVDDAEALFWTQMVMAGPIFLPWVFVWFVKVLADRDYKLSIASVFLYTGFVVFFLVGFFNPGMVGEARVTPWGVDWTPGWIYWAWSLYFLVFMGYGLYFLLKSIRGAEGNHRRQLIYVLIAVGIPITWGLVVNIGLVLMGVTEFNRFGPLGTLAMVGLLAYASVRYQLMDVRVFLKRAALAVVVYALLLALASPLVFLLHQKAVAAATGSGAFLASEVLLLSLLLSLGPVIYAYFVRRSSFFHEHAMAGLTHELKSPLAAIESALTVLTEMKRTGPTKVREAEYFEMIERNAARLRQSIDGLLHVFKLPNKGSLCAAKEIDLEAMCRKVAALHGPSAAAKEVPILIELPSSLTAVRGDAEKIEQVLSNLVSNAVKFTKRGEVRIRAANGGGSLSISVEDTGAGIPLSELPYIFDRFYQGERGRRAKGSGIGLTIAKAWVEAHGGKIWAESDGEGKGTKMTFTLPVS